MKVLLIKAATTYPPIGLAYLAAVLQQHGTEVEILDYVVEGYTPERLKQELPEKLPDLVGINCLSFNVSPSFELARMVKEVLPDVPVVFGGAHASADPIGTVRHPEVDFVVVGEGEETLVELVDVLSNGKTLEQVDGLVFKKGNGEVVLNRPRKPIEDLDSIPFPEYSLLPLDKYFEFPEMHGMVKSRKRFMPILTSRGCPYGCIYCHRTFGKRYRARSPENVIQEILILYHQYGIREFHIEDDTFNLNLNRAKAICALIMQHQLDIAIQFPNGLRADRMDEELIEKLKQAGTFMIALGVETASPRIMRMIKKHLDITKVEDIVNLAVKNGIRTWGYFMLGFPGETLEEMEETIAFAKSLNLHFVSFSIVTPFPGTELFEQLEHKEEILRCVYEIGILSFSYPIVQLSELSNSEIISLWKRAKRGFYNPKRILRIVLTIRSGREIAYYWRKFRHIILGL